jgi:hypothetical protein
MMLVVVLLLHAMCQLAMALLLLHILQRRVQLGRNTQRATQRTLLDLLSSLRLLLLLLRRRLKPRSNVT